MNQFYLNCNQSKLPRSRSWTTTTRMLWTVVLLLIWIAAFAGSGSAHAYKLNVPKVLLPFHSSKLISFVLEAKTETDSNEELCFDWYEIYNLFCILYSLKCF